MINSMGMHGTYGKNMQRPEVIWNNNPVHAPEDKKNEKTKKRNSNPKM